jgi:hypothetical protein
MNSEQTINVNAVGSLEDITFSVANLKRRIALATGQKKPDFVVKNVSTINVLSGDIHNSDVAIADGIFVGFGQTEEYRWLIPKMLSMLEENLCVLD